MSGEWTLQVVLALASLPWLALYANAFRQRAGKDSGWLVHVSYNLGFLANLTWVAMALAPQPRFPGLLEPKRLVLSPGAIAVVVAGLSLAVFFTRSNIEVMALNSRAVAGSYGSPRRLLREGAYSQVRHPMNAGGMLVFLGLCMMVGASYTLLFFPVYVLINHVFTIVEERMALRPTFGDDFVAYARRVPAYFDARRGALLAAAGAVSVAAWIWLPRS
jgi:protein-S-isoprenylcysteine O-methyltransferase Ste14